MIEALALGIINIMGFGLGLIVGLIMLAIGFTLLKKYG